MISAPPRKPVLKRQQKAVLKQIRSLREQMEDLNDYLDLLEFPRPQQGQSDVYYRRSSQPTRPCLIFDRKELGFDFHSPLVGVELLGDFAGKRDVVSVRLKLQASQPF